MSHIPAAKRPTHEVVWGAERQRNELTIGERMVLAIRERIKAERSDRSPVPVQPSTAQADPRSDLADIERMVAMAKDLSSVTGEPPPKSVTRAVYGLLRSGLTAIKQGVRQRGQPGNSCISLNTFC